MPAIFTAQLAERGKNYQLTNVFFREVQHIIPSAKYVDLPNEVALKLKNLLNQGKYIEITKENVDKRNSSDIPFENFLVIESTDLSMKKAMEKARVSQKLSIYSSLLTALDIFDFFVITGKLQSMGFNVLDENNKEEVFLNIINTGDDNIITDLERFLETKSRFENISKKYRGVKEYFSEIDNCDSEEEMEEVKKVYKGSWLS